MYHVAPVSSPIATIGADEFTGAQPVPGRGSDPVLLAPGLPPNPLLLLVLLLGGNARGRSINWRQPGWCAMWL